MHNKIHDHPWGPLRVELQCYTLNIPPSLSKYTFIHTPVSPYSSLKSVQEWSITVEKDAQLLTHKRILAPVQMANCLQIKPIYWLGGNTLNLLLSWELLLLGKILGIALCRLKEEGKLFQVLRILNPQPHFCCWGLSDDNVWIFDEISLIGMMTDTVNNVMPESIVCKL